jgi:hypothetical protein
MLSAGAYHRIGSGPDQLAGWQCGVVWCRMCVYPLQMCSSTVVLASGRCTGFHTCVVITLHVVFTIPSQSMHGCNAFLCGLTTGCPVIVLAMASTTPMLLLLWHE